MSNVMVQLNSYDFLWVFDSRVCSNSGVLILHDIELDLSRAFHANLMIQFVFNDDMAYPCSFTIKVTQDDQLYLLCHCPSSVSQLHVDLNWTCRFLSKLSCCLSPGHCVFRFFTILALFINMCLGAKIAIHFPAFKSVSNYSKLCLIFFLIKGLHRKVSPPSTHVRVIPNSSWIFLPMVLSTVLDFCCADTSAHLKMACSSKTAGCRATRAPSSTSKTRVRNLSVFKVILGSFDALVSKWPVTQKGLPVEQNMILVEHIWGTFDKNGCL